VNFLLIFYLFFLHITLFGVNTDDLTYVCIIKDQEVRHAQLKNILNTEINVLSISIDGDIAVEKDEILYLLAIKENEIYSPLQFFTGIEMLAKKERFKEVYLATSEEPEGVRLFFKLVGNYLIEKIKIQGIWYGAELYKRLSGLNRYDIFEQKKVMNGQEKIKQYMQQQGYFDADIKSTSVVDENQKLVTVIFDVQLNTRYKIQHIFLKKHTLFSHHPELQNIFLAYSKKKLLFQPYTHQNIEDVLLYSMNKLKKEGFFINDIYIKELVREKTKKVDLGCMISLMYDKKIIIEGNKFFSTATLLNYVYSLFKKEKIISAAMITESLLYFYKQQGFFSVTIDIKNDNQATTIFLIEEGLQKKISTINFILKESEETHVPLLKKIMHPLLLHAPFNQEIIDQALIYLIESLKKESFLDAYIISHSIESISKEDIVLHIVIGIGEKYFIKKVIFDTEEHIKKLISDCITQYDFFLTPILLTEEYEKINNVLCRAGYIKAQIIHEIEKNQEGYELRWKINTGAPTMLDKIIVLGNPYINFTAVLKYVSGKTKNGIPQENYIHYALENLQKLGMYERIELYPDIYNTSSKRALFLRLIPDNQFEIRTRLGTELQHIQDYQTFGGFTYKCGFSLILRNKLKKADVCQFDADFAGSHREIIISQSIPLGFAVFNHFPFSCVWILKAQGYDMRYEQPGVIGYSKNLYAIHRDGILFNFYNSRETSYFNASIGFEIQKTSIKNKNALQIAHAIDFDIDFISVRIPYFFVDMSIMADFLDNKVEPTRGVSSLISYKSMISLTKNKSSFAKLLFEQTFFMSYFSLVFGLRARFGYLFNQNFSKISPIERFYLGGSHSVRGYEADLFPPIHSFIDNDGKKIWLPRGGKIMYNINVEIKKKMMKYFSFVLFHDSGFLADHLNDKNTSVLHTSGIGFRIETPFGPLRFDIAWKWKLVHEHEKRYGWYLTFGRAF